MVVVVVLWCTCIEQRHPTLDYFPWPPFQWLFPENSCKFAPSFVLKTIFWGFLRCFRPLLLAHQPCRSNLVQNDSFHSHVFGRSTPTMRSYWSLFLTPIDTTKKNLSQSTTEHQNEGRWTGVSSRLARRWGVKTLRLGTVV